MMTKTKIKWQLENTYMQGQDSYVYIYFFTLFVIGSYFLCLEEYVFIKTFYHEFE